MSFGFSIGDAVLLTQLAWRTVQKSRQACGEYDDLTHEVTSLHVILKRLETERKKTESPLNRPGDTCDAELGTIVNGCTKTLRVLDKILDKYNALSDQERSTRKLWQQIKFGNGQIANLTDQRNMLTYYTSALSLYLNMISVGAVGRVEQQMENAGGELREIKLAVNSITAHFLAQANHEGSVLTAYDNDEKAVWKEFRRELIRDGFSSHHLRKHKTQIQAYLQELGDRGLLDDPATGDCDTGVEFGSGTEQAHTSSSELNDISTSQVEDTAPNDMVSPSCTSGYQNIESARSPSCQVGSVNILTSKTTSASRHQSEPQKASSADSGQQYFGGSKGVKSLVDRGPASSKPDSENLPQPAIPNWAEPRRTKSPKSPSRRHSLTKGGNEHHVGGLNSNVTEVDSKDRSWPASTESFPDNVGTKDINGNNSSEGDVTVAHDWESTTGLDYIWVTKRRSTNSGRAYHENRISKILADEGVTESNSDGPGFSCTLAGIEGISRSSESSSERNVPSSAADARVRLFPELSPEQRAHASVFTVRKVRGGKYFVAIKDNKVVLAEFREAMLHLIYIMCRMSACLDRGHIGQEPSFFSIDKGLDTLSVHFAAAQEQYKEGLDLICRLKRSMEYPIWWSFSLGSDDTFRLSKNVDIILQRTEDAHRPIFMRAAFYLPQETANEEVTRIICVWTIRYKKSPVYVPFDSCKLKQDIYMYSLKRAPHYGFTGCATCKRALRKVLSREGHGNLVLCENCWSLHRAIMESCDVALYVARLDWFYPPKGVITLLKLRMDALWKYEEYQESVAIGPVKYFLEQICRMWPQLENPQQEGLGKLAVCQEIIEEDLKLSQKGRLEPRCEHPRYHR